MLKKQNIDLKKRQNFNKLELKYKYLKTLFRVGNNDQHYFLRNLKKKLNMYKGQTKNFCILSGRSRGVHRYFKLSRIKIRQLGAAGILGQITK